MRFFFVLKDLARLSVGHAAGPFGIDGQAGLRTACHSDMPHDRWAGPPRNQGATAPTPETKLLQ